jgi:hypothetical protein
VKQKDAVGYLLQFLVNHGVSIKKVTIHVLKLILPQKPQDSLKQIMILCMHYSSKILILEDKEE